MNYKYLLGSILLIWLSACTYKVHVPEEAIETKVFTLGRLTPGDTLRLFFSRTGPITSRVNPEELVVCNLNPVLLENGVPVDTFRPCKKIKIYHDYIIDSMFYTSPYPVSAGNSYAFKVETPYGNLYAETRIPDEIPIRVIHYETIQTVDGKLHKVEVEIRDPAGKDNYYQFSMKITDTVYGYTENIYPDYIRLDPVIENDEVGIYDDCYIFTDRFFDGQTRRLNLYFLDWRIEEEGETVLIQRHTDRNLYDYYYFLNNAPGDWEISYGISGGMLPVGNVKGGYGWWYAYREKRDTLH